MKRRGRIKSRIFPTAFTGLNDLSLAYLLPEVIKDAKQIIQTDEGAASALKGDAEAYELVTEVVASERENLKMLQWNSGCHDENTINRANSLTRQDLIRRVKSHRTQRLNHDSGRIPLSKSEEVSRENSWRVFS